MVKRLCAAVLAAALCLCLFGCSFSGLDTQNLMSPPKANADQQSIQKLLQGVRPDLKFVYPKSGEYRSAIIMQDFTGDGVKDAIGFYALEEKGVEVQFLVKSAGEWKTAATFQNTATQVDRVCFGDLSGNGCTDVLIGWGSTAGTTGRTASVNAYLYDGGDVREYPLGTYGEMAVTDLDDDQVNEVFTIDKFFPTEEEGAEASPAQARVYVFEDGSVRESVSTVADNSISTYSSLVFGKIATDLYGVVVDGAKADGSMTTQVFYLDSGQLKNAPGGVNGENYANPFSRPSAATFTSRDVNGDGLIEIPIATQLPGIPEDVTLDPTCYLVEWSFFQPGGSPRTALRTLMNPRENYWFFLPYRLKGRISASNDADKRTVTYMEAVSDEEGQMLLGAPLFSIRVFTQSAWESRGQSSGFEKLASQDGADLVYGIQILTQDKAYLRSINEIKENFRLIAE